MEKRKIGKACSWMMADGHTVSLLFTPFPSGNVAGGCLMDGNGDFLIAINNNLSPQRQRKALGHELCHIYEKHFLLDDYFAQNRTDLPCIGISRREQIATCCAWKMYGLWRDGKLPGQA